LDYHHNHLIAHKEAPLVGDGEEGHNSVVSEIYSGKRKLIVAMLQNT